jgi:hypothetical protein
MASSPRRWLRKDEYGNRQPPPGWLFGFTVAALALVAITLTVVALAQR